MYLSSHNQARHAVVPAGIILRNVGTWLVIRYKSDVTKLTFLPGCVYERYIRNHYDSKQFHVQLDKIKSDVTSILQAIACLP